jgi:hypothetical protein
MTILAGIAREVIGLFIDDGSLALAIIAVAAVAMIAAALGATSVAGVVLLLGCLGVLTENVLRAQRR